MRKTFDRGYVNFRERPTVADFNLASSQIDQSIRDYLFHLTRRRTSIADPSPSLPVDGFIGGGFRVLPTSPPSSTVRITPGLGFQVDETSEGLATNFESIGGLDDVSPIKPLVLTKFQQISLAPAPAAGNTRIDIIEVRYTRYLDDPSTRTMFSEPQDDFIPALVRKTLSFAMDDLTGQVNTPAESTTPIGYKVGAAALTGTEVPPPTSTGYIKIAEIVVRNAVDNPPGTVDADYITDERALIYPHGQGVVSGRISLRTAANVKPTLLSLSAPPGIKVAAHGVALNSGRVDLYILGGGITKAHPTVKIVRGGFNIADILVEQIAQISIGRILDPAVRTILQDPAVSDPVTLLCTRQNGVLIQFYALRQIAGATSETGFPDPIEYSFNVAID